MKNYKITALTQPDTNQTKDDVLAYVLSTQHERAAILASRADIVGGGLVQVTITYAGGVAASEIHDVMDRLAQDHAMYVTVTPNPVGQN